jgi:hypothetical protein
MNSYDPKCEELARYFLPENADAARIQEVAQAIQQTIENGLTAEETEAASQDRHQRSNELAGALKRWVG